MSAAPWYRERAAYLMGKSRAGTSSRRRAEILARQARRDQRAGVGVGEAVMQDEITPGLWHRVMGKEMHWFIKLVVLIVAAVAALVAGIGLLIGRRGIYDPLERWVAPRIGRLAWWPWAAAAGVLLVLRWVLTDWPRLGLGVGRYFPGSFVGGWAGWLQFQLIVALGSVAFLIWAWGWKAVPNGAVAPPEKNKDGSFYVPADHERSRVDPGHEAFDADEYSALAPLAPEREIPLAPPPVKETARLSDLYTDDEQPTLAERLGHEAPLPTTEPVEADEVGFDPTDDMNDTDDEEENR